MKSHNVFETATNTLVSKERKLNNTNFADSELSDELDDADLVAINGGSLVSGPLISLGNIYLLSENGSHDGGYNTTSNNQNAYTSVNNTNTTDTNTVGN